METFGSIVLLIAIIAVVVFFKKRKADKLAGLKKAYDDAKNSGDKKGALAAGRAYYSSLRKDGSLTIYDEQAITNDIAAMS